MVSLNGFEMIIRHSGSQTSGFQTPFRRCGRRVVPGASALGKRVVSGAEDIWLALTGRPLPVFHDLQTDLVR